MKEIIQKAIAAAKKAGSLEPKLRHGKCMRRRAGGYCGASIIRPLEKGIYWCAKCRQDMDDRVKWEYEEEAGI